MLTIGLIDYLNTQPFQATLAQRLAGAPVDFVRGVPTALNRGLVDGSVHLAPISAIEAARHAEDVVILPGLTIASLGAVKTVLLFSWKADPRELDGQPVALTDHSATAVALLKLLCSERYGVQPDFRVRPQNLGQMMAECEAALVIGDAALVEGTARRMLVNPQGETARPYVFDLGDEWLKHTSLPFVFALFAACRDTLDELAHYRVHEALLQSKADGQATLDELARAYAPRLGLPVGVCARYLQDLRYDLTDWDRQGLNLFLDKALGADRVPLEYWGEAIAA